MTDICNPAQKSTGNLILWEKGKSGNPAGRSKGSRNKLQENFLKALSEDFAEGGIAAIQNMRVEKPGDYVRMVASLMPKQLEIERPLQEMTDDELTDSIEALRRFIAQGAGTGSANTAQSEPAQVLPPLH